MVSIKELVELAGPTAECAGGNVTAVVSGKRVLLGGAMGNPKTFMLTEAGEDVVKAAKAPAPKKGLKPKKADPVEEPQAPADDLGDIEL